MYFSGIRIDFVDLLTRGRGGDGAGESVNEKRKRPLELNLLCFFHLALSLLYSSGWPLKKGTG